MPLIERFSLRKLHRGNSYQIVTFEPDGVTYDLTLKHEDKYYILNTSEARTVIKEIQNKCNETSRVSPVGLEIVVLKSFMQDGRTDVIVKDND